MASSDKEVEEQLLEAGHKIEDPPTSVEELLPLLDNIESLLARVEQSPSNSMQKAVTPSLKALVSDQLLRHSDVDVKVAVAACISEITRITAPDAPYNDEQMKEVFHLIVSSFEDLSDKSSRSYKKRTSILETVAKVRSCVVMLDLECDGLIIEMFQHFFKTVRDYHPENVFSSMETIMSLVLEESEDISVEVLSPILASVKKDGEEIQPIARKLGERVLNNCSTRLKPYLAQAVKTLGISFDDYSDVVASICKELSSSLEPNNLHEDGENVVAENRSAGASGDKVDEQPTEVATPERVNRAVEEHHDSVMSNGIAQSGEDGSIVENKKEGEHGEEFKLVKPLEDTEPVNVNSEKAGGSKGRAGKMTKKRGRKPNSLKITERSESSHVDTKREPENVLVESHGEEHPSSHGGRSENLPSENEVDLKPSSPRATETESVNVASPSQSRSLPDESNSNKVGKNKRKDGSAKDETSSADDVSKKLSEGTSDSGINQNTDEEEKAPAGISDDNKPAATEDAVERGSDTISDNEAKRLKQSARKADGTSKSSSGSLKQSEVKRRQGSGKSVSGKSMKKSSGDHDKKETGSSSKPTLKTSNDEKILDKTTKTPSKRKRTPGKEKESETKDLDEGLIGSKIKVWWPKDRMFYEGIVDSFDPAKKKHRVLYTDGDEEVLNLKKEKWELVDVNSGSEREQTADLASPESALDIPQKKKTKLNANESSKRGKADGSPKKDGVTSSSKSKSAATKSDRESGSKVEGKSKESLSKAGRPATVTGGKSKDPASKTGIKTGDAAPKTGSKTGDAAPKTTSKSKNDDSDSHKSGKSKDDETSTPASAKSKQDATKSGKSKQGTPKTSTIPKGKSPKTGDKSNSNVSTKVKFTSSKSKEGGDSKTPTTSTKTTESSKAALTKTTENSKAASTKTTESSKAASTKTTESSKAASAKTMENSKGKSQNSSSDLGSELKTGKKRRREAKG